VFFFGFIPEPTSSHHQTYITGGPQNIKFVQHIDSQGTSTGNCSFYHSLSPNDQESTLYSSNPSRNRENVFPGWKTPGLFSRWIVTHPEKLPILEKNPEKKDITYV
jgi:hypothetical protein